MEVIGGETDIFATIRTLLGVASRLVTLVPDLVVDNCRARMVAVALYDETAAALACPHVTA
jgi:hypothetical protein